MCRAVSLLLCSLSRTGARRGVALYGQRAWLGERFRRGRRHAARVPNPRWKQSRRRDLRCHARRSPHANTYFGSKMFALINNACSRVIVARVLVGATLGSELLSRADDQVCGVPGENAEIRDLDLYVMGLNHHGPDCASGVPEAELVHGSDPVNEVMAALGPVRTTSDHIALVNAAADGPDAVREALRRYANEGAGWTDDAEDADE